MTQPEGWDRYDAWHTLFDGACIARGHSESKSLAAELCAAFDKTTQSDFDTACKNIGNWRFGRRTPRRHHFAALTTILAIDSDPVLRGRWDALYLKALKAVPADIGKETSDVAPATLPTPPGTLRWRPIWLAGFGAAAVTTITVAVIAGPWRAAEMRLIPFASSVSLQVGDSMILHGARPKDCGAEPLDWPLVHAHLPQLSIGTWSDGGKGVRPSTVCGGQLVPARALRFTATAPGKADIQLEGNPISIEVR